MMLWMVAREFWVVAKGFLPVSVDVAQVPLSNWDFSAIFTDLLVKTYINTVKHTQAQRCDDAGVFLLNEGWCVCR